MPKKGDNLGAITAAASVDHHGELVVIDNEVFKAIITLGIEIIDPESGTSTYGDIVEIPHDKLPSHTHGTVMTVVASNKDYKLQKTIKDDGHIRTIEITR
jgi:hypothetical protein